MERFHVGQRVCIIKERGKVGVVYEVDEEKKLAYVRWGDQEPKRRRPTRWALLCDADEKPVPIWLRPKNENSQSESQHQPLEHDGEQDREGLVHAKFDATSPEQEQATELLTSLGLRGADITLQNSKWVKKQSAFVAAGASKSQLKYAIRLHVNSSISNLAT